MICFCLQADGKESGTCEVTDMMHDAMRGHQALPDRACRGVCVPPAGLVTTLINDQMKTALGCSECVKWFAAVELLLSTNEAPE